MVQPALEDLVFIKHRNGCTARLYVASSEKMVHIDDNSITLTVTSSPYWNAIDYDRHAKDPSQSYRTRRYRNGFDNYLRLGHRHLHWHIAPVPPATLNHPCPFPEEIPYRLTQLYSYPGDTVLDPFLGSGQTTKVAFALGRNTVGYDVIESYVQYAFNRLEEPLAIREKQIVTEYKHLDINAPLGALRRSRSRKTRHGSGISGRKLLADEEEYQDNLQTREKRLLPAQTISQI